MAAGFRIKIAGEDLGPFLPGRIDLKAAFSIKSASGLTPMEVIEGVAKMDPAALQVMVWFLSTQSFDEGSQRYAANGTNLDMSSINFALDDIETEAVEGEAPKEETSPPDVTTTSSL